MNYILYYAPGAASMAVHWMFIEMGIPFETRLIDIDKGAQRADDYLRLNPGGRVPTLMVDGKAHGESVSLLMLLAECHPTSNLAPLPGSSDRADWLERMIYLANTVLPAMRDWFYADTDGDPAGADAVRALSRKRIEQAWDKLDACLADDQSYFVGDKLSTVDLMATVLMRWSRNMPRPATQWPRLGDYIERLRFLPSFIEVNKREGLTDWPPIDVA